MTDTPKPAARTDAAAAPWRAAISAYGQWWPHSRVWAVVRQTRPWFWPLGWGGAYLGAVLATRRWVPLTAEPLDAIAVAVVLGPLVWGAVLAVNDRHDLPSDRRNPRKALSPLVTGVVTTDEVGRWSAAWSAAAMLVALTVGPVFTAGTVLVLLLGWLYSAPPVRLKGRPGADVAVNAIVVGVLAPLAGWSLHRPVTAYPPVLAVLGLLLAAALYLPTTVMDVEADRAAGDATAAARWSPAACRRAGITLWTVAVVSWLACCHLGVFLERKNWLAQDLAAPALLILYVLLTRRPTIFRMAVVAAAFAVPAIDFLIGYAGQNIA